MTTFLLDLYTSWILKAMLEAMHNTIDLHSSKVVARWFGKQSQERCPYGELGYQFESLVIDTFTEEFAEQWYEWTCIQ